MESSSQCVAYWTKLFTPHLLLSANTPKFNFSFWSPLVSVWTRPINAQWYQQEPSTSRPVVAMCNSCWALFSWEKRLDCFYNYLFCMKRKKQTIEICRNVKWVICYVEKSLSVHTLAKGNSNWSKLLDRIGSPVWKNHTASKLHATLWHCEIEGQSNLVYGSGYGGHNIFPKNQYQLSQAISLHFFFFLFPKNTKQHFLLLYIADYLCSYPPIIG